jgi:esterase/lipase
MLKRPKLSTQTPESRVPENLQIKDLSDWLVNYEAQQPFVVDGGAARIRYQDPESPDQTPLAFLGIHGFSACRQETAPVTQRLAEDFKANLIEVRLAGHGLTESGMDCPAEDWLASVVDSYDLACRLGEQVILVGTSTGAPLACWADRQLQQRYKAPFAHLFMAPNFKINNPFDFLLTMPFAESIVPRLLGRTHSWTPENDAAARYWTSTYDIQAVIEMQKVVDWFRAQPTRAWTTPMAMMVMDNDPTISAKAAKQVFQRWQTDDKARLPILTEPDAIAHVFAGDIVAPNRTEQTIEAFSGFIQSLKDQPKHRR